ncbi:MAG: DNA-binding protein [Gammaproteobacteria bacterium]|nr:DNA-binding protein [Gammaproteobacteria bacterium]
MKTVIETPTFTKQVDKIWSEDERLEFVTFIAKNPTAGDVIPGAEGARKVRWSVSGKGKSGGVRVIYFNQNKGVLYLIAIYKKSVKETMKSKEIRGAI